MPDAIHAPSAHAAMQESLQNAGGLIQGEHDIILEGDDVIHDEGEDVFEDILDNEELARELGLPIELLTAVARMTPGEAQALQASLR